MNWKHNHHSVVECSTVDANIKPLSAVNPEPSKVPSFKPGIGQNTVLGALSAAIHSANLVDSTSSPPFLNIKGCMSWSVNQICDLALFHPRSKKK